MPNTIPERVAAARIRAAYRVRATSAAVCAGAAVFALGAGMGMALCLNSAYLAALATLPACALATLCAHRALTRRRAPKPSPRGRALGVLLGALMILLALFAFAALISLSQQTLLPHARLTFIAQTAFVLTALCCVCGGAGVSRLAFALRFVIVVGMAALCLRLLSFETMAGLFPLLGAGARQTGLAALCMLAGAAPSLIIALPPPELCQVDEETRLRATPGPGFFIGRVMAGCAFAVLLLAALSLCNTYESIAAQRAWGRRMIVMCQNAPREGMAAVALTLLQTACLALLAAQSLLCGAQALAFAVPRAGRYALAGTIVLAGALLTALVYAGIDWAMRAGPLLALPMAACCLLCLRKGETL